VVQLLTHRAYASSAGPAAPDGGRAQCHGLAARPVSFLPARRPVATRLSPAGRHGYRFPLVRRYRTRNGAGKTTTLRMLLGLVRPTSGWIRVLGLPPGSPAALAKIGSMGEVAFYPFLSGRDNLRAAARRCGIGNKRVDGVLLRVGLAERAEDKVAGYSLGMRQRLGVAVALLKDPQLLILDEPSNGLDPAGQLDMRALIHQLGAEGHTVVLSSHDMDEVEDLCSRVAVIGGGRMLADGSPVQLRGQPRLWLRAEPADQAAASGRELGCGRAGVGKGSPLILGIPVG
jgi:ABC-type multidrug transport system ATPase subunit